MKYNTSYSSSRATALTTLGQTVSTLPFNLKAAQEALAVVEKEGGEELVVEAVATVAAFESITRVADACIRIKPPAFIMKVMMFVNVVVFNSGRLLLGGAAAAAVCMAVWVKVGKQG